MKKLTRLVLVATLSAAFITTPRASVVTAGPSVTLSALSVAFTTPAADSVAELSSPAATLPNAKWEGWLYGASGYARAVEMQKELNIPLVVYFYTDWCSYCRTLDNQYLPSAPVQDYLRGVVKVRIHAEQGFAERALAKRYGVSGYPSFFVMRNPAARPVNVSPFRRVGNLTPTQLAIAYQAVAPVSQKVAAVRRPGHSGKFRERSGEPVTTRTTTKAGAQIVTVMPAATTPRVQSRKARP
ncbi:MAG: thioredoxin family protein [Pyrinomonadaceae bacterium]